MSSFADQLLVLVLLINILILGTHRARVAIRAIALQGVVLGMMPLLIHPVQGHILLITLFVVLAKGVCIPWLLFGALSKIEFSEDLPPFLGYAGNVIAGAVATVMAFAFAARLPLAPHHQELLTVPAALATILAGFIALASRRKAINQVIGYLMLENGIFIFGLLLTEAMPLMVEAGALLDLIAGIFVMGIIINQIGREFSSIDTSRMTALREEE
ncbi:hydrogenase [Oryzomonas japonica]|uniref:Hydrogenase n=1 Tax=Oryzomonas japonica TaxID=2603858 RepID=A0A7J4ZQK2_9BACT|nr:hydrogenase [Oryzomonas japonica]KAB0665341.1 hydrogenase [Oryzomonas japonica]